MCLLIIFLTFFGFLSIFFFGSWIGNRGSSILALLTIGLTCFFSFILFYEVAFCKLVCSFKLYSFFFSGAFRLQFGFLFDTLTVTMLVVISLISFLVHSYSIEYMSEDPNLGRFMAKLNFFSFCMILLVTADNFVQLFFGWEGVGLASYLLINFWFTRIQANKSAIKAILVNRIGDIGLLFALGCIYNFAYSVDFPVIFSIFRFYDFYDLNFYFLSNNFSVLDFICFFLFIGAIGKSAQIGLHTWLPDAMEGPTPVSALLHAATMVTAGIFLVCRFSPLFELSTGVLSLISFFGALTAIFSATAGLVQNDMKRVIAYSTCSQLGYMFFICGLSHYSVGMFHLFNHAFFKALLFLSAGSVIHGLSDEQDIRKMGGLYVAFPLTHSLIVIGSFSLIGFPFISGFYSKDLMLELGFSTYSLNGFFCYLLGVLAAGCTSFYSFRLLFRVFCFEPCGFKSRFKFVHEPGVLMLIPMLFLGIFSIFSGWLFKDLFVGWGSLFWGNSLYCNSRFNFLVEGEFIEDLDVKNLVFYLSMASLYLCRRSFTRYRCYYIDPYLEGDILQFRSLWIDPYVECDNVYFYYFYVFLVKKWFFDKVYKIFVIQPVLVSGYIVTFFLVDKGFLEIIGPYGFKNFVSRLSLLLLKSHDGRLSKYFVFFLLALNLIFFCFFNFIL